AGDGFRNRSRAWKAMRCVEGPAATLAAAAMITSSTPRRLGPIAHIHPAPRPASRASPTTRGAPRCMLHVADAAARPMPPRQPFGAAGGVFLEDAAQAAG